VTMSLKSDFDADEINQVETSTFASNESSAKSLNIPIPEQLKSYISDSKCQFMKYIHF
jgi:hypothetical protein